MMKVMRIVMDKHKRILYILLLFAFTIGILSFSIYKKATKKRIIVEEMVKEVVEVKQLPKTNETVLMIMDLNPKVDKNVAKAIADSVGKYSKKYSLSIPLVLSLMFRESGFRPIITSKANCIGLMQINPKAHPKKVKPYKHSQLYHIDINVDIGCQILREYLTKRRTIKGALESYLGASNKGYMMDILSTCVELGIKN
jgi:hypothetical protein